MIEVEFTDAVMLGIEIEFTCNGKLYFESHLADDKWYIECIDNQTTQYFKSAINLLDNAIIEGVLLKKQWDNIKIQYIL